MRATAALACALWLGALAATGARDAAAQQPDAHPLRRFAPTFVYDRDERDYSIPVDAVPGGARLRGAALHVPRRLRGRAVVYGRETRGRGGRRWLQYWLFFAYNGQDRGIVRAGRHAGDWEVAMVALDERGAPAALTLSQHSGGETCAWSEARRDRSGHPLLYVANGSHALYFRPGGRDRTWPDPNDEADGRGRAVRPDVHPLRGAWVRWPGRWGGARAGFVPGEQSSPRGPAFQPQGRFDDPDSFAAGAARGCEAGRCDRIGECDGIETAVQGGAAAIVLGTLALVAARRRRRRR